MEIEINKNSGIPLYLQIKEQLKEYIQNDQLKKGSQLPTERDLSLKLKVSRNTVSMAYQELVQEKLISSISGKGTFIIAEVVTSKLFISSDKH
jgi:GntR family transcriptional regulator